MKDDFKFNIGERVRVNHHSLPEWEGVIYRRNNTGDGIEYWVTNAPYIVPGFPVLAWESELERMYYLLV